MEDLAALLAQSCFEAALDTSFEVALPSSGQSLSLRLFRVTPRSAPPGYEQYSALFKGPADPLLPQATYLMKHPAFGELPLFIVPISRDGSGVTYEACITRRTGTAAEPRR